MVLDNLSAHKTKAVKRFLRPHPKVRLHAADLFWVVESGGAVVCEDPMRRKFPGVFTSVADLARKLQK